MASKILNEKLKHLKENSFLIKNNIGILHSITSELDKVNN